MEIKRLTELNETTGEIQILVREGGENYLDGHTTQYVFSKDCPPEFEPVAEKCYDIENHEIKLGIDIDILFKALFKGFYFKPLKTTAFMKLEAHTKGLCYSKETTGLEEKNSFFESIGYDNKPLPLFKVCLSVDDLSINVSIWTIESGYKFLQQLDLSGYGKTWSLTEEELLEN